jgi:hypothetical protein
VEPKTAEKPADPQQLIEGDTAQAPKVEAPAAKAEAPAAPAPKVEAQVAPAPAPVVTAKPKKKVQRYYQQEDDYYSQDDYGYQPSYSNSYGGDGCE